MNKYKCIDLFAGAGGLSYGFLETNRFEIKLAVENNKHAQETYEYNHPSADIKGDINEIDFSLINQEYGDVDIVIGGPPCQGFSNANRQHNYLISPKNQLIKKYLQAVQLINPKVIVMENVKNITSSKHKFLLSNFENSDIVSLDVQLSDESIILGSLKDNSKQFCDFLNSIEANKIDSYILEGEIFKVLNQIYKKSKNYDTFCEYVEKHRIRILKTLNSWDTSKYEYWCLESSTLNSKIKQVFENDDIKEIFTLLNTTIESIIETQNMIKKVKDLYTYDIYHETLMLSENKEIILHTKSYKIIEFILKKVKSLGYIIDFDVLNAANYGVPQLRQRFILLGVKEECANTKVTMPQPKFSDKGDFYTIKDAIKDLENYKPVTSLEEHKALKTKKNKASNSLHELLANSDVITNHIITDTRENAMNRFKALKQGQNFHDLKDELKNTYHDPSRTQNTVYKRLEYDVPSDTVVNVRKSMWIHPTKDRAISIREAARLQSFPDSFIFWGTKDSQYQQIGNAVPPLLGKAIAEKIIEILD